MTSKNLFFKLMKEDFKRRIWAVSLIGLSFFFLFPVVAAFQAGVIREAMTQELGLLRYQNWIEGWLSFDCGMTAFVIVLTALICGLSSFSYLDSKQKVDFYHSIPVRREKMYIANYLDGVLILAVPYAVSLVLAVLVGVSNGAQGWVLWKTAASAFGMHMVYFLLLYTTTVVAVMLTGNLVIAFLGSAVLNFYIPVAVTLIQVCFETFYSTFVWSSMQKSMEHGLRISPVMEYTYQISQHIDGEFSWTALLGAFAAAMALAVLGCFLYRKRPSEAAGKAMAFAVTRPVIRILITMASALGLGLFFWSMRESTGWAVFGVLCGTVISHCVIEIIYHFDFKKLFANKAQLAVCGLVSIAVLFVFRYDLTGYDKYLPDAGNVKDAAVEVDILKGWVSYGETQKEPDGSYVWKGIPSSSFVMENMRYTDTENLLSIAAAGIGAMEQERAVQPEVEEAYSGYGYGSGDSGDTERISNITIRYTLKSGRHVYRRYSIDIDAVMPQISKLYASAEYQEGTFPLMGRGPESVADVYYSEQGQKIRLGQLTAEEKAVMLETYQREFSSITPEQMEGEYPVGLIRFTSPMDEEGLKWWERQEADGFKQYSGYSSYSHDRYLADKDYYPVYPSFTGTIRLLEEQQIDVGSYYANMDIRSVNIRWYDAYSDGWDGGRKEIVVTDPDEIQELKKVMLGTGRRYYNQLFSTSGLDVDIWVMEDGSTESYSTEFPRDGVPEFVIERLNGGRGH